MDKVDIRKLSDQDRALLRQQVIRLRKQGVTNNEIAERLGLSHETTSRWWQWYRREGDSMLAVPKRGRKHGQQRRLNRQQEIHIQNIIVEHVPEQLNLPYALWNRQAVGQLILQQFGIDLPVRTVAEYLARWGYRLQKPIQKAYEQRPVEVERWMQDSYPAIKAKARAEKAEIYWCDETALPATGDLLIETPAGNTIKLRLNAQQQEHIRMISAINNKGKLRFMLYKHTINSKRLIFFMSHIVKDAGQKVILILDRLKVHHYKPVKEWLINNTDKLEIFYLPTYSLDVALDQHLNNSGVQSAHGKRGGIAASKAPISAKAKYASH